MSGWRQTSAGQPSPRALSIMLGAASNENFSAHTLLCILQQAAACTSLLAPPPTMAAEGKVALRFCCTTAH